MKIINKQLLDETSERAKQSPRLRMNYNFHEQLDDPVNRLLNAMEPDTYIRPHRHLNPDNDGNITEKLLLDPLAGSYGAEIKPGIWHSLLVLESGTVIYEVKPGPFAPLHPENMAPWSPEPDDEKGIDEYLTYLTSNL